MRALALLALASCASSAPPPAPVEPHPPPAPGTATETQTETRPPRVPAGPGAPGAACTAERPFAQGSCAAGTLCAPMPGGYCFAFCDDGCPDGTVCVESPNAGTVCLRSCDGDGGCRSGEGYSCDRAWGACAPQGFAAPRPPSCNVGTPPRRAFGDAVLVSTGELSATYSIEPAATLLADGSVLAAYMAMGDGMDADNAIVTARIAANGRPGPPVAVPSPRRRAFDPWLASDGRRAYLVWLAHDGGGRDLRSMVAVSTSDDGGASWVGPVAAHDTGDCAAGQPFCFDKPMIVTLPARRPAPAPVVVFYWSEAREELRAVRSDDRGQTFGPAVSAGRGAYGDVVVGPDGSLHVVYVTWDGHPTSRFGDPAALVEYVRSDDGGATFSAPVRVSAEGEPIPFYFSNPQVVVDGRRGLLYSVYPTGGPDAAWNIVLATSPDGGRTFSRTRVNDDHPCANHMTPSAALDERTGRLHVMWAENRDGEGRMVAAACDPGGARCAENESVHDAPFTAYGLLRHARTWRGEYDGFLVDARRRLLHAVYTMPWNDDGAPTSRIFYARARL